MTTNRTMTTNKIGYSTYESKISNVERIMNMLEGLINVDNFKKEIGIIKKEVDTRFENFNPNNNDIHYNFLEQMCAKIDSMEAIVNKSYLPFYELHLLTKQIDEKINDIDYESIDSYIEKCKEVINLINNVEPYNREDLRSIINKAYQAVYKVLIKEEVYDRTTLLNYLVNEGKRVNQENIGRLIEKDITLIDETIKYNELEGIRKNGLGYDYLSRNVIREIAKHYYSDHYSAVEQQKATAFSEFHKNLDNLKKDNEDITTKKKAITNLRIRIGAVWAKMISYALIPVMACATSAVIGGRIDRNYKTQSKTYNVETREVIEEKEDYELKTDGSKIITIYEPWEEDKSLLHSNKYKRTIKKYEILDDTTVEEIMNTPLEDILHDNAKLTNETEAYSNDLRKEEIKEREVQLREVSQDYDDHKLGQTGLILGGLLGGFIGGMGFAFYEDEERKFRDWNDDRHRLINSRGKYPDNKEMRTKTRDLKKDMLRAQQEYQKKTNTYGKVNDTTFDGDVKKYVRK